MHTSHYKHHIGITSQAAFCSVPLRLDAYSDCQFACSFCFAKARGGKRSSKSNTVTNDVALRSRLQRVARGEKQSAVDDMLSRRIPLQFGGMTDPFSPWEERHRATLRILNVLADYDYPTLVSTKGTLIADPVYKSVLMAGNFYVRFSFTAADEALASRLEPGVPPRDSRLRAMSKLADAGLPIGARFQPLILGYEDHAVELLRKVTAAGSRQVAVEYLKWPMEQSKHHAQLLARHLPGCLDRYMALGGRRVGREYVLPAAVKVERLKTLKSAADDFGVIFGYAENDLLHLNRFRSCCNAADLFLKSANFFEDNILARIKATPPRKTFDLSKLDSWRPQHNILVYMNSHSRNSSGGSVPDPWRAYLAAKWSAPSWRGGPSAFYGIAETGEFDLAGLPIFIAPEDMEAGFSADASATRAV
jgi:DNA repair photolyase